MQMEKVFKFVRSFLFLQINTFHSYKELFFTCTFPWLHLRCCALLSASVTLSSLQLCRFFAALIMFTCHKDFNSCSWFTQINHLDAWWIYLVIISPFANLMFSYQVFQCFQITPKRNLLLLLELLSSHHSWWCFYFFGPFCVSTFREAEAMMVSMHLGKNAADSTR